MDGAFAPRVQSAIGLGALALVAGAAAIGVVPVLLAAAFVVVQQARAPQQETLH